MPPDESTAAGLLARLLSDPDFRSGFRADPARACRAMGLSEVSRELEGGAGEAFQTLEVRESRSSLAGVLLAAAAEGVGVAELVRSVRAGEGDRWEAASALSAAMPAVDAAGGLAGVAERDDLPTCPVCMLKDPAAPPTYTSCAACGGPAAVGAVLCETCVSERRVAPRPRAPTERPAAPRPVAPAPAASAPPPVAVAAEAVPSGAPAAPAGAPPPVDPALMTNTNAGGKLHGSEFSMPDAEGAPGPSGRIHAGYDLFASENAPIRSPVAGTIVEVRPSRGTSGQVFGGTVKVEAPDGRVWVFRHVTPGSVQVGQRVAAGDQIAAVSPWTDGPEHTHIELWKTFSGGYNAPNMEDPLPHLKALYSGTPAAGAPANGVPAAAPPATPPVAPPALAVPASPPAPVAPVRAEDLLADGRVLAPPAVAAELAAADLDPRVATTLATLAESYRIGVTAVESRAGVDRIVIGAVNGRPVDPGNVDARDLAQELAALDVSLRPSEVGTPWRIRSQGFYSDPALRNRIEIAYRGDAPAPVAAPSAPPAPPPAAAATAPPPAAVPAAPSQPAVAPPGVAPPAVAQPVGVPPAVAPPAVAPPAVAPAGVAPAGVVPPPPAPAAGPPPAEPPAGRTPEPATSAGRASAVFAAVGGDPSPEGGPAAGAPRHANTARVLPAVPPPPAATPPPPPAAPVAPPPAAPVAPPPAAPPVPGPPPPAPAAIPDGGDAAALLPDPSDPYPGDADKPRLAGWMARQAQKAGLPAELPVMAALVESGLSNLDHGHADSLGFFQMRESIWNRGEYAGYPDKPELQMTWFLTQALEIKRKRLAEGLTGFGTDPATYGEWIADVERPAEQYRGRYQTRLEEARRLIWGGAA